MTSSVVEETSGRNPQLSCLFCQVRKPELETGGAAGRMNEAGLGMEELPFFICSRCETMETEKSRFFPAKLESAWKEERCREESGRSNSGAPCNCAPCGERRKADAEAVTELEGLHKAWAGLRFAVRTMYREGLGPDGLARHPRPGTTQPRTFNLPHLASAVKRLCARDPHQLFSCLQTLGVQYVMEVQVNLVEILIAPARRGVTGGEGGSLGLDQSRLFLRETLDSFSAFQDTVRHMSAFMADLDEKHLEKFGITWKVVHHHLFDDIVYQNKHVQAALPKMSNILKVDLTAEEGSTGTGIRVPQEDLPPAAFELAQSFRALDRLMKTSRQIWQKASQRMQEFAQKQMKLYKATLKAKQRMLKEDLEFFKLQRRLLAECVAKGRPAAAAKAGSDKDLCDFTDTIRALLTAGRRGARHREEPRASDATCPNCNSRHCPCDECTISHMITCGLVGPDEEGDLALPHAFLDEMSYAGGGSSLHSSDDDPDVDELIALDEDSDPAELESALLLRSEKERLLSMLPSGNFFTSTGNLSHSPPADPKLQDLYSDDEDVSDEEPSDFKNMLQSYLAKKKLENPSLGKTNSDLMEQVMALQELESEETEANQRRSTNSSPVQESDDDQDYRFLEDLLKSGMVGLVEGNEGGSREITDEMLAFMKEEVGRAERGEAKDGPEIIVPPDVLRELEAMGVPASDLLLHRKLLEKAINSGEAAARFKTGKNWSAAMICTKARPVPATGIGKTATRPKVVVKEASGWVEGAEDGTAVIAEAKPPNKDPNRPRTNSVSVATQVEDKETEPHGHHHHHHHHPHHLDPAEADGLPCAGKGDRHCCACCCLEMLGKETRSGRSQVLDRLRQKLKKKADSGSGRTSKEREEGGDGEGKATRGEESLDTLLAYIEGKGAGGVRGGGGVHGPGGDRQGCADKSKSKAAVKRQRKRQAAAAKAAPLRPKDNLPDIGDFFDDSLLADEVFRPRDDLTGLDQEDRDVENFKKLLLASQPQVNRRKVQLNLSGFLQQRSRLQRT